MSLDKEIFDGKTLSDLFSEIHTNSTTTRAQVKGLIGELKPNREYWRCYFNRSYDKRVYGDWS